MVPITILLADRQVPDNQIDPLAVDEALARGEPIKTRAPGVIDYLDAVESTDAEAAVILTRPPELTAMWRHACHVPWLVGPAGRGRGHADGGVGPGTGDRGRRRGGPGRQQLARRRRRRGARGRRPSAGDRGVGHRRAAGGRRDGRARQARRGPPTIFEARQGTIEPLRVLDGEDPVTALADLYGRQRGAGGSRRVHRRRAPAPEGRPWPSDSPGWSVPSGRRRSAAQPMTVYTGRGVIGIAWLDRA